MRRSTKLLSLLLVCLALGIAICLLLQQQSFALGIVWHSQYQYTVTDKIQAFAKLGVFQGNYLNPLGQYNNVFWITNTGNVPITDWFIKDIDSSGDTTFDDNTPPTFGINVTNGAPATEISGAETRKNTDSDPDLDSIEFDFSTVPIRPMLTYYVSIITDHPLPGRSLTEISTAAQPKINGDTSFTSNFNKVARLKSGSPVSLIQTVDTPSMPFNLEFDYLFETSTDSILEIFLGDTYIGELSASSSTYNVYRHAVFPISGELLDLVAVDLSFTLDGDPDSILSLDNIIFPGLVNGAFDLINLPTLSDIGWDSPEIAAGWRTQIAGSGNIHVALVQVSEPSRLTLFLAGLIAICMASVGSLIKYACKECMQMHGVTH